MAKKQRMLRVRNNTLAFIGTFPQQVFKTENLNTSRYQAHKMPEIFDEVICKPLYILHTN